MSNKPYTKAEFKDLIDSSTSDNDVLVIIAGLFSVNIMSSSSLNGQLMSASALLDMSKQNIPTKDYPRVVGRVISNLPLSFFERVKLAYHVLTMKSKCVASIDL